MTSYKEELGEKIKKARKEKGLTQEQLAELAHIDPKTLIKIEGGKRNPTLKTLNKIAIALKVPLQDLIG